jgi:hypothetical protein
MAHQVGATSPSTLTQSVVVQNGWDTHTMGPNGKPLIKPATYSVTTQEWEASGRTVVSIPHVAWQGLIAPNAVGEKDEQKKTQNDVARFYGAAHQYIPAPFTFHALDTSGFGE